MKGSEAKKEINKGSVEEFIRKNFMPKDVFNIDDQQMEGLYAQAYNFYQTGRFKDAIQIFRLLVSLNSTEAKYVLGLGACLHMMKEYKDAVDTYTACCLLDTESPIPFYHMSDCYIAMKDPFSALVTLDMAIKKAGSKPEFQMLKDRAAMTMQNIQKEVKEEGKK